MAQALLSKCAVAGQRVQCDAVATSRPLAFSRKINQAPRRSVATLASSSSTAKGAAVSLPGLAAAVFGTGAMLMSAPPPAEALVIGDFDLPDFFLYFVAAYSAGKWFYNQSMWWTKEKAEAAGIDVTDLFVQPGMEAPNAGKGLFPSAKEGMPYSTFGKTNIVMRERIMMKEFGAQLKAAGVNCSDINEKNYGSEHAMYLEFKKRVKEL